jgi:serine/threonine-protein kinase
VNPDGWQRVQEAFLAALEREPPGREEYLLRELGGEPELLGEARSLLAAYGGDTAEAGGGSAAAAPAGEPVAGDCIGPYRLLRRLGAGGAGVVFLAAREAPFSAKVALKLLRHAALPQDSWRRLERERQILAGMEHPNVARLLDGGATADGRPYFVMEYIDGLPIDLYCDRHHLGIDRRLGIVRQVCTAVHACHQNLVVHRDLKPSNILVSADGTPKLLDFGIAKLLEPEHFPLAVEPTATGLRPMTPSYASPEQLRGGRVSTTSDVYSLGVLLYHLLSGHLPSEDPRYLAERFLPEGVPAPPLAPSQAAGSERSGGAVAEAVAQSRSLQPAQLRRRLAGDLDTIVLMALRHEPHRRYASAEQLGADLERHLRGLPVIARGDSRLYRLAKSLRRHRAVTTVAVAGLLLVALLQVALALQVRRTARERDAASLERDRAEQVTRFLVDLFAVSDPTRTGVTGDSLTGLLDRAAERAVRELGDQPAVQAAALDAIGAVHANLGV